MDFTDLRINHQRFRSNLEALSKIGATESGGVDRPAFSQAHLNARKWFKAQILQSGLAFQVDGAANHSGILFSRKKNAPTLLLGSHLDSVPNGGLYDGVLGVLAALEVLQTVKDSGIELPCNFEVIDFTDEEGCLIGDFGSSAVSGSLNFSDLEKISGGLERVTACLHVFGKSPTDLLSARRDPAKLAGYLELHIEQGSKLKNSGIQIGTVTGIAGVGAYQINFLGRPDHSGTTAMQERLDASQGAAAYIQAVRELVIRHFPDSVANVIWSKTLPGALNVVPGIVELGLEFRSPDMLILKSLEKTLLTLAESAANLHGLGFEIQRLSVREPVNTSKQMLAFVRSAADNLSFSTLDLASGAWHDAQMFVPICPTGMIFIPSENGSHSPLESADWDDCVNGANVLLHTALQAASTFSTL